MPTRLLTCLALSLLASPLWAASVYTTRPDDPAAVYVDPPDASVEGDHSALLQAAVDRAAASPNGGIVFVPEGRYRVTRTLIVWRGVRIIGYGTTRPVLVLPARTPGFQAGIGLMVHFTSARQPRSNAQNAPPVPFPPPGIVPPADIPDANQGTFYSSMMNIDIEIGDGNPAAVAIRFHVAQHGVLSHMDFHVGSGLAALTDIGNVGQHLRFYGGRYGILTANTSPFWPYTLIDAIFDGQREAAIREHMAGLTVVRTTFRNVPIGISIDRDYSDHLWLKDARFENVSGAAIVIDKERNPTTQIGAADALCSNVPVFARYRQSGRTLAAPSTAYRVTRFHHGVHVRGADSTGGIETEFDAQPLPAMPPPLAAALRALPPTREWVNVRSLGVKGDGQTDDTRALQAAVDAHRVLYLPSGFYIVRDTIRLRPDSVLIALHPNTTQLDLPDRTSGFDGVGPPRALLEAPRGGATIVSGLGLFTGAVNPRATAVLWMAGRDSLLDDIQIHGFAGTFFPPEVRATLFGTGQPSGPGAGRPSGSFGAGRWGAQYPSIWVTRGGGGTFHNIWSPNTYAQSGFYVSDTTTPGVVYQLSAEHHLFGEIRLDRVENWEFHGPQTEEEASTSAEAVAFDISGSKNITIANYRAYRVTRSYAPFPAAVRVYGSSGIRFRNVYANAEHGYGVCDENGCGTFLRAGKFTYDNVLEDITLGSRVRERNLAVLDVGPPSPGLRRPRPPLPAGNRRASPAMVAGVTVEKLADGFHSIAGAAVDASGTLFFVDRHQQRIFSWCPEARLTIVRDAPLDPVNLAFDRSGNLLVLSSAGPAGTVYAFRPDGPRDELTVLEPQPRAAGAGATFALPATIWADGQFRNHLDLERYEYETHAEMFAREVTTAVPRAYLSPDRSLLLPAGRVFTQGPDGAYPGMDPTGWRWSHALDAYSLITARPGERVYVTSGAENRTYRAIVREDGTLGDLERFAERGGESVVADADGNVYIANGQIFVHRATGEPIGRIDVPERPTGLRFGGPDGKTLYVLTHRSLYAARISATW
jgi:Pectate lyase superfamily protein/SMP-30/Gluconolactonase/LRE-like region